MDNVTAEEAIQLARAVIAQALADVGIGTARRHGPPSQSTPEYREAYAFLTARSGTWAESRRLWCDQADIDERKLLGIGSTLPEPSAVCLGAAPSRQSKTYHLGIKMREALAERGVDFMSCRVTKDALPVLKELGFRSPTGKSLSYDSVYWARAAIK